MTKTQQVPEQYRAGFIEALDKRTATGQALRQRYIDLSDDIGGLPQLSYMQKSLVERVLHLELLIGQQEAALRDGQEIDTGRYTQAINALSGLIGKLGLERQARDVSLQDVISRGSSR